MFWRLALVGANPPGLIKDINILQLFDLGILGNVPSFVTVVLTVYTLVWVQVINVIIFDHNLLLFINNTI